MDYVSPEQAREMPGLRLALTAGTPGPWSEAAKGILRVKGIDFVPVRQEGGGENAALFAWTGHRNAPVAVWDDEPPRAGWAEILMLAERLKPEPALVPAEMAARADMLGLSHLICGEQGFGWNRRLLMTRDLIAMDDGTAPAVRGTVTLLKRYGWAEAEAAAAPARIAAILRHLAARLAAQAARGSAYFIGDGLTAVDIHWACFANLLDPLPPEVNPMPKMLRLLFERRDPVVAAAIDPILLRHRDLIYERHLGLPLDF